MNLLSTVPLSSLIGLIVTLMSKEADTFPWCARVKMRVRNNFGVPISI